jgi:hypothetical protein
MTRASAVPPSGPVTTTVPPFWPVRVGCRVVTVSPVIRVTEWVPAGTSAAAVREVPEPAAERPEYADGTSADAVRELDSARRDALTEARTPQRLDGIFFTCFPVETEIRGLLSGIRLGFTRLGWQESPSEHVNRGVKWQ